MKSSAANVEDRVGRDPATEGCIRKVARQSALGQALYGFYLIQSVSQYLEVGLVTTPILQMKRRLRKNGCLGS